jgi:hypothetical protein
MPIITAQEIIAIAFTEPIDPALISDDIIKVAENKYLIPTITKLVYDDLSVHPDIYKTLMIDYIKPYLAYCVKFLFYSQYLTESSTDPIILYKTSEIVNESISVSEVKKNLLLNILLSGIFPLYNSPIKKRINGFLIK